MKVLRTVVILAAIAAAPLLPLVLAQNSGLAQNQGSGNDGNAAQSALKILSPTPGQVLRQNFVTIKYELTNAAVSGGSSNFRVQLDDHDPVTTMSTEYTFNSLPSGKHTVTAELVDANNTPVANAHSEIQFDVQSASGTQVPPVNQASLADVDDLPPASSALPLLSVIGFGALLGGIASAMRTR